MSLETLDWYITNAVEQKLDDCDIWGNRGPEVIAEIAAKVKQNIVEVAMVSISNEYMQEVVDNSVDWDNM